MRLVIAEDSVLLREGLASLLATHGFDVVGTAGNLDDILELVRRQRPDVAIIDIRLPPSWTDEGIRAAEEIRSDAALPTGVLVLSQYVDPTFALRLLSHGQRGVGYLRKDDVIASSGFAETIRRIGRGESVIDPTLVADLLGRRVRQDPLDRLSAREREVLALIAEGRSNAGIAEALTITEKTVEFHVSSIFSKLGLEGSAGEHRRVLAVLAFLRRDPGEPDLPDGSRA
jgi:DNA-binding NarL/FixJ family response regulator